MDLWQHVQECSVIGDVWMLGNMMFANGDTLTLGKVGKSTIMGKNDMPSKTLNVSPSGARLDVT